MRERTLLKQRMDNIKKMADAAKKVSKEIRESKPESTILNTKAEPYPT